MTHSYLYITYVNLFAMCIYCKLKHKPFINHICFNQIQSC